MPWKVNTMSESRREFVEPALRSGSNMSELGPSVRDLAEDGVQGLGRYRWQVEYRGWKINRGGRRAVRIARV